MECSKHKGSDLIVVCSQCGNEPICSKCLTELHNGHITDSFDESFKIVRKNLQALLSNNADDLTKLGTYTEKITDVQKQQITKPEEITKQIKEKRAVLYKRIDDGAEAIQKEYTEEWQRNNDTLQELHHMVSKQVEKGKDFESKIKEILMKESNVEAVQDAFKLKQVTLDVDFPVPKVVHLKDIAVNSGNVKYLFGTVTERTTSEEEVSSKSESNQGKLSHFSDFYASDRVSVLSPSKRGLCYLKCAGYTQLRELDDQGTRHESYDFSYVDIVRGIEYQESSVYFCCNNPHCIKQLLLPQGQYHTLFSTCNLKPQDLRRLSTREFLVVLVDVYSSERADDSQRLMIKYDESGKEISKVEKDIFGDYLFTVPFRVRTNKSEDTIAVVNEVTDELSYLILLDKHFNVKLRYTGNERIVDGNSKFIEPDPELEENKFRIYDAIFDSDDNILICEMHTRSVQKLSPACEVLQILYEFEYSPSSIAINSDGKVWVGNEDSKVYVLEYTSAKESEDDD